MSSCVRKGCSEAAGSYSCSTSVGVIYPASCLIPACQTCTCLHTQTGSSAGDQSWSLISYQSDYFCFACVPHERGCPASFAFIGIHSVGIRTSGHEVRGQWNTCHLLQASPNSALHLQNTRHHRIDWCSSSFFVPWLDLTMTENKYLHYKDSLTETIVL